MTATPAEPVRIDYVASERQATAHRTYVDELFYGGAAGGGKSRFVRMEALAFALEVPGAAILILRRTFPDLSQPGGMIPQLLMEIPRELGTYNTTQHVWRMRNGSTITLGYLGSDGDVVNYQGAEYQLIIVDELTQQTEFRYRYLMSRLRASGAVAERLAELGYRPRIIATGNPGGVGHAWVKARFIDPAPPGKVWRPTPTLEEPRPGTRCFIPAKVTDNPHIDDGYIDRLNALADDDRRALRDGDWDVYQGQRFRDFRRSVHVIDPEQLPLPLGGTVRAVGVDYGLDAPFAALWGAKLADGLVVVYRELYAAGLTAAEQAEAILEAEARGERSKGRPIPIALDPSTWARSHNHHAPPKGGQTAGTLEHDVPPPGSIAAAYRDVFGSSVVKARNDRLASVSLLAGKLRVRPDGIPRILVYSTCRNLIRTLPALPRDARRPEDVDTKAEDHAYDALRYLLMELEHAGPVHTADEAEARRVAVERAARVEAVTGGIGSASF